MRTHLLSPNFATKTDAIIMATRDIKYLAVHCTATAQKTTIPQLLAIFKANGWRMPGYHYAITPDGTVHKLLDEDKVSNGVKGYNSVSINVAYIGGVEKRGVKVVGVDNRTPEQKEALRQLLTELRSRYPKAVIQGHRDFSPDSNGNGIIDPWERIKECPCFEAKIEYKDI